MKFNSKKIAIFIINGYQKILSPDKGFLKKLGIIRNPVCVFYPTCSDYSKQAIEKYGIFKGFWLTLKRISRCHPWQKNRIDLLK
ncbi:MAG TPA: membrane protein insertion efficiency factor YidD [Candidatus Paceibacterota bacterium]|nr:membrane protein insertion efficiency factor YidD [Candidatus Paceibacterota bacterium]